MMRREIGKPRDLAAGLAFSAFGAGTVLIASRYRLGDLTSMGPGYFPRILGICLLALGGILIVSGLIGRGERIAAMHMRPLLIIALSIPAFGLTLVHLGLVAASLQTVFFTRLAGPSYRPLETVVLAVALAGSCAALFVYGLKLPLQLYP
jgi:hypothetical protein